MVRLRLHCGNFPQGRGTFGGTLFHHRVNYFTLQNVPSISGWLSTPLLEIHSCKQLQKLLHTLSLRVFFDHDNKELKEPFSSLRGNKCFPVQKITCTLQLPSALRSISSFSSLFWSSLTAPISMHRLLFPAKRQS